MTPPCHSIGPGREGPKKPLAGKTKKRRQRGSEREDEEGVSSLPPLKKARTGNLSQQDRALEQSSPTLDLHNISLSGLKNSDDVEYHIAPSILKGLLASYQFTDMNIISSSKIQTKVTSIVEKLGSFSFVAAKKPDIVLLRAKGAVSSKLISIVEIAKREIVRAGGKWYQYNALDQIIASPSSNSTLKGTVLGQGRKSDMATGDMELDEKEDSQTINEEGIVFEMMKTPLERAMEGKPKIRAVPLVLIFLSRVRSDTLKEAYGEQTNALTR